MDVGIMGYASTKIARTQRPAQVDTGQERGTCRSQVGKEKGFDEFRGSPSSAGRPQGGFFSDLALQQGQHIFHKDKSRAV